MAKNDVVLLDAIIQERVKEANPSRKPDEVFELLAFEQVLKPFDPSREEIDTGWVDGRDDGGIDGFFTFVNGHALKDLSLFQWPKRSAEIDVHIITCKHHDTFQQAPLNSLLASLPELLDLSQTDIYLKTKYSAELLRARTLLVEAYKSLSTASPALHFHFSYASRGDSHLVGDNVQSRADQITNVTQQLFSHCRASFHFVGSTELIALYRQTKSFSLELQTMELMTSGQSSYVCIVRLDHYYNFVKDENGSLRRYLFDSNVRDYLGRNQVNDDIAASLGDPDSPEFWWLNNGVTILATGASAMGKHLHLQDIQIVNGLQTTESIFRHFESGSRYSADRRVLVKVIVSSNVEVRDQIIRATNNQSLVEHASLHATDKVQRDIEDILERNDWFYERRKNYYRNIGKPMAKFVTPMYLAAGYVALIMKNPAKAAKLKARFMRNERGYESVFSDGVPLGVWVAMTQLLKMVEDVLSDIQADRPSSEDKFSAKWRHLLAFLTAARIFGTFGFSADDLARLRASDVTNDLVLQMWEVIMSSTRALSKHRPFLNADFVLECCKRAADQYNLSKPSTVGRQEPPVDGLRMKDRVYVSEDFIVQVNGLLPEQPWRRGTNLLVAEQLGCHKRFVSAAITALMERGARLRQKDGRVYDKHGNVVAQDPDRDPTLQGGVLARSPDQSAMELRLLPPEAGRKSMLNGDDEVTSETDSNSDATVVP